VKHPGVSAVEVSQNAKIGVVSATYASQQTCPKDCAFRGSGCYAETGNVGMQTSRLNREAEDAGQSKLQLARSEARAIRQLTGRFPLRLHVVGDATTNQAARVLSDAAKEYRAKFGSPVWTYTHGWRRVARESWGDVSVLASCERMEDAKLAMDEGYAAAVVVPEHCSDKAWRDEGTGLKMIPCPEQTGKSANCTTCRLCWNAGKLRELGAVIAFETHGATKKANEALKLVQIERRG
jgi:hypothetical protein